MSLEVEDGWSPALIKDEAQLDFIAAAMKYVSGSWSYWTGGSTCSEQPVPLSLYCRCNNTGDKILIFGNIVTITILKSLFIDLGSLLQNLKF